MQITNGIDIVDITRIDLVYQKFTQRFIDRILHPEEQDFILSIKQNTIDANILAKRYVAKEAFVKALGFGIGKISFLDIKIFNDSLGKPFLSPSPKCWNFMHEVLFWKNINMSLSLSDEFPYAISSVVIVYEN